MTSARQMRVLALAGAVAGMTSAWFPISTDEGAWLAIGRRLAAGGVLYEDAIDNKSPFVFWVVRALDRAPGSFELWRGVLLGALVVITAVAARAICRRYGASPGTSLGAGLIVGLSLWFASMMTLTIEMIAAACLLASLAMSVRSPLVAGLVAGAATLFDPRAVVLIPGVALLVLGRRRADGWRFSLVAASVISAWGLVVLMQPDVRFAMVELNLASRAGAPTGLVEQLAAGMRALVVPVVGLALVAKIGTWDAQAERPDVRGAWLLAGAGLAVVLVSRHGFDHYWQLVVPGLLVLAAAVGQRTTRSPISAPAAVVLISLACLAPGLHAWRMRSDQTALLGRYEQAAQHLRETLEPVGGSFLQFVGDPFLATYLPERFAGRSPLLGYLVSPNPRRDESLEEIRRQLGHVEAIADDGGLGLPREAVLPGYRPLWDLYAARLDEFPCAHRFGSLTVRYRERICPDVSG